MRADFSLDYDVLTVERPQKLYLMARFASAGAAGEKTRRPLNLSLVLDRSGSMAGAKIDYTRQAAQFLVQHLGAQDVFSVVLYNDKVETLLQPEIVTHKDTLIQRLEQIRVHGTTNLSGGWLEGCRHVAASLKAAALNRVIIISDGLANRGVTDTGQLVRMVQQKREEGVTTTTMGLGDEFNEDLMMAMANAGGGAYYFIESPEVTPHIFQEELKGLLNVVGQNLAISILPGEDVLRVNQLNAYAFQAAGRNITYHLGDIFSDEIKTLVLELDIPALQRLGECHIARLRFEYDEITGDRSTHHQSEMPVTINIRPPGALPTTAQPEVEQSVLLLKAAQARKRAIAAADRGDYQAASQVLDEVAGAIAAASVQNARLNEERAALREQSLRLAQGKEVYDEYTRKTMSTQSFYTMTGRHEDTMLLRLREQQRRQTLADEPSPVITPAAPAAPAAPVELRPGVTPTHIEWKDQLIALQPVLTRIGRAPQNEFVLNERGVSRFHCQIRREGDKLILEDLGSTNGTTLRGDRLTGPHVLSVGDVVYVCDEKLVFRLP
ncbi:MAG: VWA domain-containing protein [Anaerolineae bacterium]|nr:VWA domain-containing protein [Anaerolineae bacterium]